MMSSILPKWGVGKLFVKYRGNNLRLVKLNTKRHKTRLFLKKSEDKQENLTFNFRLHDGIEIAISLKAAEIYQFNEDWEKANNSVCTITDVLIDEEITLIKGAFSLVNVRNGTDTYREPYTFDFILRTNPILIDKLNKEKIPLTNFITNDN